MTIKAQSLSLLQRGPATSRDIADALGIGIRHASAVMCDLFQIGVLIRRRAVSQQYTRRFVWELKGELK